MKKLMLGALIVYSVAHFVHSAVLWAVTTLGGDFLTAFPGPLMYRAAAHWPLAAHPWLLLEPADSWRREIWNYGPALHFLALPFSLAQTRAQALYAILVMNYALIAATFLMWIRLLFPGPRTAVVYLVVACLWLNYFPLLEAIVGRESEIWELFLMTVGLWAIRRGREGVAGVAFGVAAMTKFLPIIFVPYLWVKGYRKACGVAVVVILTIAAMGHVLLGFEHSETFEVLMNEASASRISSAYANQALGNVLYKMFTPLNRYEPHPLPSATLFLPALRVMGALLHLAVLLACGGFLLRWRRTRLLEIECALLAIVMVLVAPHANTYYLVLMLPALSVGVSYWLRHPASMGLMLKLALVAGVALSGFLVPMKVPELITGVPGVLIARIWQAYSLPAFGAIFAALVMVGLHQQVRMERLATVDVEPR